ncbi:unnamed protein product [Euphydryas editha]|uniref:Cyclic nucleotide-binding domain-containing protein n=1 Tax=Euphydryas editha TaxID=104508 RepID=A0AAU9TF16_EUPED|nr:unnamed protein product [Euphydryas editha]
MESCFVNRCSQNSWFDKALTWQDQRSGMTSNKTKYHLLTAIYFSTTTLLSVGYGDFVPGDQFDMGFIAFLSLYGVLLSGYCVSEFSAVVTHWSRTKTAFLEVIMTIDKFMKENNMHTAIKSRIMAFYELQWQYNSGVELTGENWLEKTVVPHELRKKVLHQARFKTLTSIRFFQVKNKAFIHTLTETATDIILPPGEIVYYGGTVTRELYIIESGYCLVTCEEMRATKTERVIGPGNHLGLLVLLYGVPAVSTVITLTHCKLISISHFSYTSALNLFPDMREHEDLLTSDEKKKIEQLAKSKNSDAYLRHYNRLTQKQKKHITNILQDFFNDSFINVLEDYRRKKESYLKSFSQFHVLNKLAPYFLIPIVIRPDGIFLKTWALLRVCTAYVLSLLIPGSFTVDLLTCFPWYAIWTLFVPKHNENHTEEDHVNNYHFYHCIIRMVNVLQIYKLYAAFWAESISALKRAYLMSVVQFLLLTLFFLNLYTSILITMTCRYVVAYDNYDFFRKIEKLSLRGPFMKTTYNPDGNMICKLGSWIDGSKIFKDTYLTPTKVYLLAYYWAATSFTGAGFGDITAQDTAHMILSICINIHGVLFFGYVYARIASLKAMADQVMTTFQENLKHLVLFLNREKTPYLLKRSVIDYWKYQWKRTGGWSSYPSVLRKVKYSVDTATKDYVLPIVMSDKTSVEMDFYPLTYEADDDEEDEMDPNVFLDSPDRSIAESHGSRSITSAGNVDYVQATWLILKPHRTIAIWASLLSHVNACLFFKMSCLTPVQCQSANWISKKELNLRANYGQNDFFPLYVASLWYMINLLTITGTGDVSSQNDFEVIETVFIAIIIKFCTGLLISEMSAMITAHSSSRIAYDYGINELRDGLRDTDLSDHQMNKMWDYVRELWNRQQGKQVEVLTVHPNLTESIYDILGPEDSFGVAQGLFVGVTHHFSFRARTVVDIVYLKLDEWKYLLDFYPKSAKLVRRKVENVYLAI